ncbi:hypothetical protein WN944_020771 [Citrus x changshan-huyou]|uniref:Uncharacterized protein n=1 Tax=Citrus x changshan-huyou TaxID=2935761 RepID=A0AAP0LT29_9ROSI
MICSLLDKAKRSKPISKSLSGSSEPIIFDYDTIWKNLYPNGSLSDKASLKDLAICSSKIFNMFYPARRLANDGEDDWTLLAYLGNFLQNAQIRILKGEYGLRLRVWIWETEQQMLGECGPSRLSRRFLSQRTDWTDEPGLSTWTSIQAVNSCNREGYFALGMSSRVNQGPFEGLGVVSGRLGGTVLVSFDSSTIGVSVGNSDGEGSLEPVDGMAMSNLVISVNSASKSEVGSDSLTDFDPESEDSE